MNVPTWLAGSCSAGGRISIDMRKSTWTRGEPWLAKRGLDGIAERGFQQVFRLYLCRLLKIVRSEGCIDGAPKNPVRKTPSNGSFTFVADA